MVISLFGKIFYRKRKIRKAVVPNEMSYFALLKRFYPKYSAYVSDLRKKLKQ